MLKMTGNIGSDIAAHHDGFQRRRQLAGNFDQLGHLLAIDEQRAYASVGEEVEQLPRLVEIRHDDGD